mgnify:FL=1
MDEECATLDSVPQYTTQADHLLHDPALDMENDTSSSTDIADRAYEAAKHLRRLRDAVPRGWQSEVAERLDVRREHLSRVLNAAPTLDAVARDATNTPECED